MYPNDQSISSFSSNPSTPVNSPPPLTQTPGTSLSIHNSTPSTSWQQLTPANVVLNNSPVPVLNGIQNGQYAGPEMVHRGLHMVINQTISPPPPCVFSRHYLFSGVILSCNRTLQLVDPSVF